ncbi:F8H [Symbiodinium natans]|uniref:F8H protein n=1 Tax=Symbiodinium natans TaxID=878477 RepID=A0A812U4V5_9DINO|nr:F8H [Symbiodinium natans]
MRGEAMRGLLRLLLPCAAAALSLDEMAAEVASDAAEQQKLCQLSGSATSTNQLWALGFRKRMQMYLQRVSVYVWRLHEAIWQYFSTHAAGNTGLQSTNSCGLESPQTVPLAMDGLFTDPNCTQSSAWATWLAGLGTLTLGAGAQQAQQAEEAAAALGLSPDPGCFLGAATLLLAQVAGSWRRGRFVAALHTFAVLHDHFLTAAHPGFFLHSAWPVGDQDVRYWKDRLLYQIRRFRELVGRSLHLGAAAFTEEFIPDDVERENLGGFASHALRQELGGRQGRNRTDRTDRTDRTESSLSWHPVWELAPSAALIPFADVAPPVRVYVYGEADAGPVGKLTRSSAFCHYRQWGMDVGFHDFFRTSPVRTFDPDKADYFFVPTYACCHQVAGISDFDELDADHATLVSQLTYFQRSRGQDHIFSFHYIDLFPSWRSHIPRSVFLTPETEVGFERSLDDFGPDQGRIPPFNPLKDIVVPPFINMKDILGFETHAKPMREREHLATFAGKLWSDIVEAADVRGKVVALSSAPGFKIHAFSTIRDMLNPDGMQRLMGNSVFCLVPRGRAAWSVRFFEALWAGCVPVLLSDHYQPSFDQLFDVTRFVIKWPVSRIDDSLVSYLQSLPLEVAERYAEEARRVRCWYLYPPPEVSWIGDWPARNELEEVERRVCPNLSSSRNAFQAVIEILRRRAVKTRLRPDGFYAADPKQGYQPMPMDDHLRPIQ